MQRSDITALGTLKRESQDFNGSEIVNTLELGTIGTIQSPYFAKKSLNLDCRYI